MRTSLRWEDPPASRKGLNSGSPVTSELLLYAAEAAELRARPGEWAIIDVLNSADTSGQRAAAIRIGKVKALVDCDAVARKVDGEYRLYARYVGGDVDGSS